MQPKVKQVIINLHLSKAPPKLFFPVDVWEHRSLVIGGTVSRWAYLQIMSKQLFSLILRSTELESSAFR